MKTYLPAASTALTNRTHTARWVGVVLCSGAYSVFQPSTVHKRLSGKAFETKSEAIAAARDFMIRKNLPEWQKQ